MKASKWLAAAVVVTAFVVAARLLPVATWMKSFSGWAGHLGPAGFLLFVVVYASATVLFAPGWPLTIGAGLAFGLIEGTAAVSLGSIIGASFAFLIARFFARAQIEALTSRNERFARIDHAIGREGANLIFLLRLSPIIPFNLSNYFYGITAVRFWRYFFASWTGMLPGTVLYVYLGTIGKAGSESGQRSTSHWIGLGIGLIATIIATLLATRLAQNALRRHRVAASPS